MSSSEPVRRPNGQGGLGEIVTSLTRDMQDLVTGQIELAKAEFRDSAKSAAAGGVLFAAAAVLAVFGTLFLFVTIGFALTAAGLSPWLSFLIVSVALFGCGAILGFVGFRSVKRVKGPQRTIAAAKATGEALNQLKQG